METDDIDDRGGRLALRAVLVYSAAVVLTIVLMAMLIGGAIYVVWHVLAAFFDHISETD